MIKILLLFPVGITEMEINKTLECIEAAKSLIEADSVVYLYCEESIPENIASQFSWRFTKDTMSNFVKLLSASNPEDVIVPVFAGDVFPEDAFAEGIALFDEVEYVTMHSELQAEQEQRITDAYINLVKYQALNTTVFSNLLGQSCLTLADQFETCVKEDSIYVERFLEGEIKSLCQKLCLEQLRSVDKRHVWAFCAGHYSNDFRGNPKYLFLYLNHYRQDIKAYWLCDSESVITQVRHMGMAAYRLGTAQAELVINQTGVLVAEQVKNMIPAGLENAIYLNLWHGVGGVKAVERSMVDGHLAMEIAKKYIQHNTYYRTNEMYLAPSVFIEGIAREQLGMEEHQIIRSGYPRNIYQKEYEPIKTFEHNVFHNPLLPEDVRFATYIPTHRNQPKGDVFSSAIPDIEKLISVCEENHICMIFKMHPLLEKELSFQQAKEAYRDCPWIYFWDNSNDFYEVLDQMDLCIFDYSSMFTDFIAAGCKHYLRYAFDFTGDDLDFPLDYDQATLGRKCTTFDELLLALSNYEEDELNEDIQRISGLYWEHSTPNSMDKIANAVIAFQPVKQDLPTLHSFDIFDTLISRKVLAPEGIFYRVQERMKESAEEFPAYLLKRYPFIRRNAERNMREYYNRSMVEREDERCEIQFAEIMKRIQTLYNLSDEQTELLGQWEIEAELDNVIPLEKTITYVKQLLAQNEEVILISDMYLPKDVIQKMLAIADPVLAELPLYLSSELGYQKSAKSLYLEVYRQYAPDYRFGRWIHTGDNLHSDIKCPRSYNIETVAIKRLEFNQYEEALVQELQSYDGYLIAASMARFREQHRSMQEQFAYSFISLLFVPYVRWAMNSCKEQGKENVYLISRDGHQLKRIADVVNETEQLGLNTKYIYASRRVWRIPSFFDHIDVGFWGQGYGNMAKVNKFSKLLKALDMDEDTFREMFPELQYLNEETEIDGKEIVRLAGIFKNSEKCKQYLLKKAEEERYPTCEYLKQEMDLNAPYAIIEYWGRGYTQENFTRLWQYICGRKEPTTFYYSRSTLPSDEDNIRMNFTSHTSSQAFIESIFACINYKTVENYERVNGKWIPVTEEIVCEQDLFYAMEKYLPEFAKEYCTLPLTDRDTTGRGLIDFAISWYAEHPEWEGFTEVLAKLVDSVEMYGNKTAFAKALTMNELDEIAAGKVRGQISKNIGISYYRAEKDVQQRYREMFQLREGESPAGGGKISEASIQRNKKAQQELSARRKTQAYLQKVYDEAVRTGALEKKILLVTQGTGFAEQEYHSILRSLDEQSIYSVEKLCIKTCKMSQEALIEKFASVHVILSIAPIRQLSGIKLRPETKLIILGDTPVQFFLTGMLRKEDLREVKELQNFDFTNDISVIQTPSVVTAERAKDIYSIGTRTKILTSGSCITDCYFNNELRDNLRAQLYALYPEAEGKKIISYLPLHRYRNTKSKYAQLLDLRQMQKALGEEYFVILHLMDAAKEMMNEVEIPGFSYNLAKEFTPRSQMLLADVIIADYRDTTFEAALAGVPTFVTCWDKHSYNNRDSIFCHFDDMMFGVPIENTDTMIEQLQHLEKYDDTMRQNFIEKYLTHCDGKSAERLISYILNTEVENFTLPDIGVIPQKEKIVNVEAPVVHVCKSLDGFSSILYWMPIPNAEIYEVLVSEQQEGVFRVIGQSEIESCVHRVKDIEDATKWYCVRALYQNGTIVGPCSEAVQGTDIQEYVLPSNSTIEQLSIPEILSIIPSKKGNRLYWSGEENVAGWRVSCFYKNGNTRQVDLLQVNTWEWTDRDVNADVNTTYSISSLYWLPNGQLIESKSTLKQKVNEVCLLKPVANKFLREYFVLAWKPEKEASSYHIYRKIGIRGKYELIADLGRGKLEYAERDKLSGLVNYIIQAETEKGMKCCKPVKVNIPDVLSKPTGLTVNRTEVGNCLLWDDMPEVDAWNIRIYTKEFPTGKKLTEIPADKTWWIDTENSVDVAYGIEAVRNIGSGSQFSGYCKAVSVKE